MPKASIVTSSAEQTSKEARDQVVLDHLDLVKAIALHLSKSLPVHVDLDDLIHSGILGLLDAAKKYNPEKHVIFQKYAKHRIRGAMLDSLRQLDWASRYLRNYQKQLDTVTRDLSTNLGRTPTELEIVERMGIDLNRFRQRRMDLHTVELAAAPRPAPQNYDSAPPEPTAPLQVQPDQICIQERRREALAHAIQSLPEQYKKVVFLYYTDQLTMKEIAGVLGVNQSRVCQIHRSALSKMAMVLHSAGIHSAGAL